MPAGNTSLPKQPKPNALYRTMTGFAGSQPGRSRCGPERLATLRAVTHPVFLALIANARLLDCGAKPTKLHRCEGLAAPAEATTSSEVRAAATMVMRTVMTCSLPWV